MGFESNRSPIAANDAHAVRSILFRDWQGRIQAASDLDQLVALVRAYLAEWRPSELSLMPVQVAATALASSEDIAARAVLAAQAELKLHHDEVSGPLLREMALTLMAAASRLRFLTALRTRESHL